MQGLINYILTYKLEKVQKNYVGLKCVYDDGIWCWMPTLVNRCLIAILIIGLILISFLVYRKHKGEDGLWKKILKWDFIFCLIVLLLLFVFSLIVWFIGPVCVSCVQELNI